MIGVLLVLAHPVWGQRLAEEPWWDRSHEGGSEHYWIKSDLSRADTQAIARHLDIMYGEYSRRLASLPQRAPMKMNVMLFAKRRDYDITLRARFGVNPSGTGGAFVMNGDNHGLALWIENLPENRIKHVLQHEGFHQFAYSRFGSDLPIWVNEGLAEFFGQSVLVGDTLVLGQSHQRILTRLKNAVESESFTPFEEMIGLTHDAWNAKLNAGEAGLMYDQAWSMVHFLVYGNNGRWTDAFERYLRLINNGLPTREAFLQAFETTETHAFEERWLEYMGEMQPSAFVTAMERLEFLAAGAQTLASEGVYPESLEDLREQMLQIDFTLTINKHGREISLDSLDTELFTIPMDHLSKEQPRFVVSRPIPSLRRERRIEEAHPSPSVISTEHVEPRGLAVSWTRGEDPDTFTYRILVR